MRTHSGSAAVARGDMVPTNLNNGVARPGETPPRLSVIGTGYLGATHAVCMAELGFHVVGVDVDADKVTRLAAGVVPFFEPGLEELLRKNLEAGRLTFSTSFADATGAGIHFICVGTPQRPGERAADMRYVDAAVSNLIDAGLRPGSVLVGKSTVPAGTAVRLAEWLARDAPRTHLAWNPEFLREGFAVDDTLRPDRLVFGFAEGVTPDSPAVRALETVYAPLLTAGVPVVRTDFATAELVKVAANAFLATKISFINAMAEVCEATGGDVLGLAEALSFDPRIGGRFLRPGLGFGGGCLPKDIRAFQARADELGVGSALDFLADVDAVNLRRRDRVVALATDLLGGDARGKRVAILGAAFKPNSDDIRDSPALAVAERLRQAGATVTVYDPAALSNARRAYPELIYTDEGATIAARGAHLVAHLTEWMEFRELDPAVLTPIVAAPVIIDGRHTLDAHAWRSAGWSYHALGRPRA
jgi:UDPglucose 6-dehydrogenase